MIFFFKFEINKKLLQILICFYLNRHLNIVETTSTTTNPLAIDDQIDEVIQTQQYVENSLHLEIVPVDDTIDVELSEQPNQSNQTTTIVFECDICAKGFKQEKSLIKHMSTKHNIECDFIGQQFKCQYCDKQYSKENLLLKHVQCHGMNTNNLHGICAQCSEKHVIIQIYFNFR